MNHARHLIMIVRACFCTMSPPSLIGVSYVAYLVWLASSGIGAGRDIAHLHLCFAPAIAGAWIGACAGRAAEWTGSRFAPTFIPALGIVSAFAAVAALGLTGLVGWISGLDARPLTALATAAMVVGVACGCARPSVTTYLFVGLVVLVPFTTQLSSAVSMPTVGVAGVGASVVALVAATLALVRIAFHLRPTGLTSLSSMARRRQGNLLWRRLWEPSMRRIAAWSGMLAAGCTFVHRLPGLEWRDGPLIVVIGSVCVNLGTTGTSASLPRGPLPGASWLLLSGIARTRADAGRRMLWRVVADSSFAAGVFTAVAIALGPDWKLVEMMLVALAASHVYLATACGSRWLMSSRLSVLVATPVVVAITGLVWTTGPWGLPTATAACVLTGVAAVYLGGLGMGRVDLDVAPQAEPAR